MGMILTDEQQAILDGAKGETMAKVMKTLVMFGEAFHAEKMVPVTSRYNHLVTSFGLGVLQPVYDLMQQLIDAGAVSGQKFSADPRPLDPNVPANLLQQLVFKKFMYNKQDFYEGQLEKLGLLNKDAFTCTCYMSEVGNKPEQGEVLSWSESSAVVYANSVLGARCNRNSGIMDIMGSIVGFVPYFGLLTDEGRRATWVIKIETSKKPEAQLLGSAIGMKVMEDVPYVVGLDKWLGTELDDAACTYLKDFGAATASNGAVGLYHIANLTPEAKAQGEALIAEGARVYVIDDAELQRVKDSYPVVWKNRNAKPKLCFMGCPHMSLEQLKTWTDRVEQALADAAATRAEADAYLAEAKAELAATGEKARRLSHEAIENAALDAERIVDTAQDEADALLQKAREQMRQEKQAAIERAHTEVVGLASDIAARILSREVTLKDNREIAERFFHGTEGGA